MKYDKLAYTKRAVYQMLKTSTYVSLRFYSGPVVTKAQFLAANEGNLFSGGSIYYPYYDAVIAELGLTEIMHRQKNNACVKWVDENTIEIDLGYDYIYQVDRYYTAGTPTQAILYIGHVDNPKVNHPRALMMFTVGAVGSGAEIELSSLDISNSSNREMFGPIRINFSGSGVPAP